MKFNEWTVYNIIINEVLFMNFQSRFKTWIYCGIIAMLVELLYNRIIVMLVVCNFRKKLFL